MNAHKLDFKKVFAMLAQPKEKVEPLSDVKIITETISFIAKTGEVISRPIRIYLPTNVVKPMPLIYIAHYEITDDALELRAYLKKGWAVASCENFQNEYNGQLTDDDLVFNNAALYYLRNRAEFDKNKIAVVGGSAGGYMTFMLSALQLGICCSVVSSGISNVYFNFYLYFQKASLLNQKAMAEMTDEERKNIIANLGKFPIPFLGGVSGLFLPILNNFPDASDMVRWEAFSPVSLTEYFCNPLLITHYTSDVLVPIDQISKRYTYESPGESLPRDYFHRLPQKIKGKLNKALEERLPQTDTHTNCIPAHHSDDDWKIPFEENMRFNIVILDEGAIEGYASHSIYPGTGRADDTPYLEAMFLRGATKTNVLTKEKLEMLVTRYEGKSVQLPAHKGIEDEVYGSLAVYRKEVVGELKKWVSDNGMKAFATLCKKLISSNPDYSSALTEICQKIQGA